MWEVITSPIAISILTHGIALLLGHYFGYQSGYLNGRIEQIQRETGRIDKILEGERI